MTNPVHVVSFDTFTAVDEASDTPLLGTSDQTILPLGGTLMMYGDGGSGKTTVSIDIVVHMAAGRSWMDFPVPRPVRTLLIENEGPRGKFRRKLAEKARTWPGPPFTQNISVMEEPWTEFNLREESHRQGLADVIGRDDIDIVMMGPLVSLGMIGEGQSSGITEFMELVSDIREKASRPWTLWIIHHESKSGDVSGAWSKVPDTLIRVDAITHGWTRMTFRKVRWASDFHGKVMNMEWKEGECYRGSWA